MEKKSNLLGRLDVKAFTLIELLVVVLIIGILAAVALPQYQKAVMKSRYAALKTLTSSLANAREAYYLASGTEPTSFAELALEPGGTPQNEGDVTRIFSWGSCTLASTYTRCTNTQIDMVYQIYTPRVSNGRKLCVVEHSSSVSSTQNQVCKQDTHSTNYYDHSGTIWVWSY